MQKVESIVQPKIKDHMNSQNLKPRDCFFEEHKNMMKDGERWMKDTATSCTVVGALIATIMFAAVFTVPGGNNQTTGFPIFSEEKLFILFIVSDSFTFWFLNFSIDVFGNSHITLCRRGFPQILTDKDDNRSFYSFILYYNHDDSLFRCCFNYSTKIMDGHSCHLFCQYPSYLIRTDAIPSSC